MIEEGPMYDERLGYKAKLHNKNEENAGGNWRVSRCTTRKPEKRLGNSETEKECTLAKNQRTNHSYTTRGVSDCADVFLLCPNP